MTAIDRLFDRLYEEFNPMVARIAAKYSKQFTIIPREDIEQECWMWFLEHKRKLSEWIELPVKERDSLIARSLHNQAMAYCVKEKAAILGYSPNDLFWYNANFIKEMLPLVLSPDWKKASEMSHGKSAGGRLDEGGNWMAYAADINAAYQNLSESEQALVGRFYAEDIPGDVLMEESERPTARAAMMAANRAVHKMVRYLGGKDPFKFIDKENENGTVSSNRIGHDPLQDSDGTDFLGSPDFGYQEQGEEVSEES